MTKAQQDSDLRAGLPDGQVERSKQRSKINVKKKSEHLEYLNRLLGII